MASVLKGQEGVIPTTVPESEEEFHIKGKQDLVVSKKSTVSWVTRQSTTQEC